MLAAATARRNAADDTGAIGKALLGMESALLAGEALDDDAGALVDKYAHGESEA
jgi:hypothetical protein